MPKLQNRLQAEFQWLAHHAGARGSRHWTAGDLRNLTATSL